MQGLLDLFIFRKRIIFANGDCDGLAPTRHSSLLLILAFFILLSSALYYKDASQRYNLITYYDSTFLNKWQIHTLLLSFISLFLFAPSNTISVFLIKSSTSGNEPLAASRDIPL